jgi:hypothetical protein
MLLEELELGTGGNCEQLLRKVEAPAADDKGGFRKRDP